MDNSPWETEIGLLPLEARLCLQAAAKTVVTPDDPLARIRAINAASDWVKHNYPNYFKKGI